MRKPATITEVDGDNVVARLDDGREIKFERIPLRVGAAVMIDEGDEFVDVYRFADEMEFKRRG